MFKFKKVFTGTYTATHKNGAVVSIEAMDVSEYGEGFEWRLTTEGDWDGDETTFATTKRELVAISNDYESRL